MTGEERLEGGEERTRGRGREERAGRRGRGSKRIKREAWEAHEEKKRTI